MTNTQTEMQATPAARLTLALMLAILWLLLTGSLNGQELAAGLILIFVVAFLARGKTHILNGVRWSILLPVWIMAYLVYFAGALFRSNFDVARRVLTPSLPIRPGVVQVRTNLESALGRLLLANSITLTPGTLTVDAEDDLLTIHWIDCPPDVDIDSATREIATGFERYLVRFVR